MIARAAITQDDMVGDGTTSLVVLIGEILRQSQLLVDDGVHPRVLTVGLEAAKIELLKVSP